MRARVGKTLLLLTVGGTLLLGLGGCDNYAPVDFDRHDRYDRSERNDRYDRSGRDDRYDRSDRNDRYGDAGYNAAGYNDAGYTDDDYDGNYDGFYDGFYGPFIGGYWASDNYFYYWGRDRRYHRDDGRHFRREHFQGAKSFRGDRGRRDGGN